MKCLILCHHVLYTCTDCTNISTFVTASSRYLNFALSCANSNQPKDTVLCCPLHTNKRKTGQTFTHLHYSICKALGFETTDKWYTHMPKPVCEKGDVTVLWNQAVHTDREVTANRPDIIIKNKKEKTCTLIDVAIPINRNVVQKEAEKKLKYKSLCIEIQRMWNLKCTILPVIIGGTGIVTRSLRKNLETTRKTFDRFTTKDRYTWNITHNKESTAV